MILPKTIQCGKTEYTIGEKLFEGDICNLHACTYKLKEELPSDATFWDHIQFEGEVENQVILKVSRSAADNDLVTHEAKILKRLFPPDKADEKFYRYLPRLLGSTLVGKRAANILPRFKGLVSLAEILEAYPKGIDFRDMVWMYKRSLASLGFAHQENVIHGAVIPSHILVDPIGHGAKLLDWCYAVEHNRHPVKAMVPAFKSYYAPEILERCRVSPYTDTSMVSRCAIGLVGGNPQTGAMPDAVPTEVQTFLKRAAFASDNAPLDIAWDMHAEFDGVLEQVLGKPRYREFKMPS